MSKERSGNPSADDAGDLRNLFPDPAKPGAPTPPPREKKAPSSGTPAKESNPSPRASDGWPEWMGDATPASAPAKPPAAPPPVSPPKPAVARRQEAAAAARRPAAPASAPAPSPAPSERKAAPRKAEAPARPVAAAAPPPAPEESAPGRWRRSAISAFAALMALLAGEMAARWRPEAAIRFQTFLGEARTRLAASMPAAALVPIGIGLVFVVSASVVWQSGRARRPFFLPLVLLLCAASAAFGMFRGGHDVDVERNAAIFRGRVGSLETELGALRQKLASSLSAETKAEGLRMEL